jgi:hypothetical protein
MSGFYPDPIPEDIRQDRESKAKQTWLQPVLASRNVRPGSKFFIDGDYTFPVLSTQQAGYIDINNATFNTTNRPTVSPATQAIRAQGGSSRRRDVAIKQSSTSFSRPVQAVPSTPPSGIRPLHLHLLQDRGMLGLPHLETPQSRLLLILPLIYQGGSFQIRSRLSGSAGLHKRPSSIKKMFLICCKFLYVNS